MKIMTLKGIKLRIYPNREQTSQLTQLFGNDRFVWNTMLEMAKKRYQNNPNSQFVDEYGMDCLLNPLKNEYSFLKFSDAKSLQVSNHNLAQAFKMLFKHKGGYPRFKSKRHKLSYTGKQPNCKILQSKRKLKLPKIGLIRSSKTSRLKNVKIKTYTVSLDPTGRYYVSFNVEDDSIKSLPKTGKVVGIDLGVADLAITSEGTKYFTFKHNWLDSQVKSWQSKYNKRLDKAKKCCYKIEHATKISRDIGYYQNWQKAKRVKANYQAKIRNKRTDYLQKITTKLVKKYDLICIEDLKAKNLLKNHHLAKSINNASWREFRIMLEYKCNWYGKKLIVVNPKNTSRVCSNCGMNTGEKPLDVREWTCPYCGKHHDRDVNAAVNILHLGLKAIG